MGHRGKKSGFILYGDSSEESVIVTMPNRPHMLTWRQGLIAEWSFAAGGWWVVKRPNDILVLASVSALCHTTHTVGMPGFWLFVIPVAPARRHFDLFGCVRNFSPKPAKTAKIKILAGPSIFSADSSSEAVAQCQAPAHTMTA